MAITPILPAWGGTMTPRERFRNQLSGKPFDRTFNMEFGYWEENFHEWDIFVKNNITSNAEADLFFNFDPIKVITTNLWLDPPFPEEVVEIRDGLKIVRDRDGVLAEVPLDGHDTIPHYIGSSVTTPDDWKRVKEERMRRDSPGRFPDIEQLKKQHPADRDYPLGIWCGSMIGCIRDMLTFEGLAYACYDYPDMVEDMVETCCQLAEDALDRLLDEFDFDYASGWEDICFKNGPIVTVDFFTNVVAPRYARISKKLKAHGIDVWYIDCDGDVRPILKAFLDNGVNALFPFEVMGCTHPGRLLDEHPELKIFGGVDKLQLVAGKEATKKYLESLVPYVERGNCIPFCDHRCPPDVTPENYLYYLELKRKLFGNGF